MSTINNPSTARPINNVSESCYTTFQRNARPTKILVKCALTICIMGLFVGAGNSESQDASRLASTTAVSEALPPARMPFKSYGLNDGLENLNIFAITQDTIGYLWVGTEEGVHRYDGDEFTPFGLEEGLPSTTISFLAPAPKGELWVGTLSGLARWNGRSFVAIDTQSGLPTGNINGLGVDQRGNVWVATAVGMFHSADGQMFRAVDGWPRANTSALYVTPDGNEVFAATGSQVGQRKGDGSLEFWDLKEIVGSEEIGAIARDAQGRVWARTTSHLLKKEIGAKGFADASALLPPGRSRAYLALDRSLNLWLPTNRGIMHHVDGRWSSIGGIAEGFAHWSAVVFEDREGSLWVGGNGTGVLRLAGRGAWSSWSTAEGLPDSAVFSIFRDSSTRFWVGTRAGLCLATEIDFVVLPGTENFHIRAITQTPDGHIWAGGNTPWILGYDPKTQRSIKYGSSEGVPESLILALRVDHSGVLWAGTSSGILRFMPNPAPGHFVQETLPEGGRETIRSLVEDQKGRLWASGVKGVFCREKDTWRRYSSAQGLQRDYVGYITVDGNCELWVAYWESLGVERFRVTEQGLTSVARYTKVGDFRINKCYFLGQDLRGQMWLGTGAGINLVSGDQVRHIGVSDGLPGEDCNANAFFVDANGDVFVGTAFGLGRYKAGTADLQEAPPIATIVSAKLGHRDLPQTGAPPVAGTPDATFEVRYAGLSFVNERQVQHQVRLIGFEGEWRTVKIREARWPLLPAGTYRFEVRARLGTRDWSEPVGISFKVRPAK